MYVDEGYVSHQDETQSSVEAGHAESLDGDMHVKSAEEIMRGAVNRDHPVFNLILEVLKDRQPGLNGNYVTAGILCGLLEDHDCLKNKFSVKGDVNA